MWSNRSLVRAAAVVVLLAASAAHWAFWYSSREREGSPLPGGVAAALLDDESYPLRLWLPFPHQNLGVVAEEVGDLGSWVAAASRLAGTRPPRLPRFGPFPFPPGRELAIAADPQTDRLAVALHAYPLVAALARLAGAVASNPWLGGGAVQLGRQSARVIWVGRTWTLTAGTAPGPAAPRRAEERPSLGLLVTATPLGWMPAGTYRVERVEDGLWLAAVAPPAGLRSRLRRLEAPGLAAAVTEGGGDGGVRAFALWAPAAEGDAAGLPAFAALARAPSERWRLPGESLLALAGRRPPTRERGAWSATAFEQAVAERGLGLAEVLEATGDSLLPPSGGRLVWASPRRLRAAAGGVADLLGRVPIFGPAETARWRDLQEVLAPFASCREMAAVLPAPAAARLTSGFADGGSGAPPALLLCGSEAVR